MKKFCMAMVLVLSCVFLLASVGLAADAPAKEKPKPPAAAKPKPIAPAQMKAAEDYWKNAQIAEMIEESMNRMSMRVPEAERAKFKADVGSKVLASGRIKKEAVEAAARTFSKGELEALSKFYASPEGRSSMEKMPAFMGQLSRIVQTELVGLMEKVRAAEAKKAAAEKAKEKKAEPKDKAKETKKAK
jgi:hypothetical protein